MSGPNLQHIIPTTEEGRKLIEAFKQQLPPTPKLSFREIELRVLAGMSKEEIEKLLK